METETKTQLIPREKRFEVADLTGFDAIVSRADSVENLFFAQLIDFSRTGVKFTVPFFAKFDEFLKIEFKFKNSSLHYAGTGRVRHIRNVEPKRWQIGCSIDPPVPDEVVAYMVKTTNQERRRFERVEVEGQGSLLRQGTIEGCDASLINVSEGGLCLSVDQEHETGQRVDFRIDNQKGSEEVIAARVRWQSSVDGGYRLGCSFADSTSHTKLVDCLVEKQQAAEGDRVNWFVAAAIMLAMFLPPATYFLFGSHSIKSPSDNVAQVAAATSPSANKLPIRSPTESSQSESIPTMNDTFASRTPDNLQQDSLKLATDTTQKPAASNAPAIPPTNSLKEESIAKPASGKRESNREPDFRQPRGEPPIDLASSNMKPETTTSSPRDKIADKSPSSTPVAKPATSKSVVSRPEVSESQTVKSQTVKSQTAESQTAESQTAESQTAESQTAESQTAESQTAESQTAESQISESSSSNSEISNPDRLKSQISNSEISNLDIWKSESRRSEISLPSDSKMEISSPLPVDPRSQPMPPQELLASGPNKVHVIPGQSHQKSATPSNPKDSPQMNSKASPLIAAVSKTDEASTRRMQKTQPLQVPSEVIRNQSSGH